MERQFNFKSALAPYFIGYLKLKEAAGQKTDSTYYMFCQFDDFLISIGHDEPIITKQIIEKWRETRLNDAPMTISHKYSAWRGLGRYMQTLGIKCYLAKNPAKGAKWRPGFAPYIFKKQQIELMMLKSTELCHKRRVIPQSALNAFPAMLRFLYSTGVRIGEALSLRVDDLHLDKQYALIRHTKSKRDHLVPICDGLVPVLSDYLEVRDKIIRYSEKPDKEILFLKGDGTKISNTSAHNWFENLLRLCGIPFLGDGFGPRIHDIRHTFAVHSIKQMVDNGTELYSALSILSTVLGHSTIASTEYYLRLTEAEFPEIANMTSQLMANVYPKIDLS